MKKAFAKARELSGTIKEYWQVRTELVKVELIDKGSDLITQMTAMFIAGTLIFCCVVFAGLALSILINRWLSSTWAGFLIVSVLYLLLAAMVWARRDRFFRMAVINMMIRQLSGYDKRN